jgi:proline iminopeptidase
MKTGAVLLRFLLGCAPPLSATQAPPNKDDVLHLVELGSGPATIIVLHGGPGFSHRYLRPEWDVLARRYRVVYYDQRGCGQSQRRGSAGWEQHVADLQTLVSRYRKRGPVILAGSSWGSWLALLYAWSHPHQVHALILSGVPPWPIGRLAMSGPIRRPSGRPPALDSAPPSIRDRWENLERARRAYEDAIDSWTQARLDSMYAGLLPQPMWDSVTSLRMASNLDRRLAARLGEGCPVSRGAIYASFQRGPRLPDLGLITTPVLVVRGTRRNMTSDGADALVRILPNRTLVTLMGAGHDPWFERPSQFFAHVGRFLNQDARISLAR